ncbi:MAG: TonB-dependent receptor [Candidatus Latescibacterota bacterium]|nr:TonB-dependent receptor [Candidatus Latescibacterota bacterium]
MVAVLAALCDTSHAQSSFIAFNGLRVPQSVLTVVSVDLENVPFETALAEISRKGSFFLSYNRSRIPVDMKMTVRMEDVHALEALNFVMEKTGTELLVTSDGQLAVVPSRAPGKQQSQRNSTISGFVRDRSDGESLPSASVVVALDDQPLMGTMTNSEGYYAARGIPAGIRVITVSYIGYASYRDTLLLAAGQELRLDVELARESVHMGEVVVTAANPAADELRHQPSVVSMKVKSLQQMPAMGEPDLLRSLQLLPGVQSSSDYSSGLYVRGGGPDQTGILLDQIRLYNPSHAFGLFSTFNPDAIKDVTLYKGAYPAQYGGNLGAVLDVQNRDGNRREASTSGGVSLISSRLMTEGPLGNGSWMVAARRTYIDPVLRVIRGENETLDGLGFWFYDVNAKVNTQLSVNDNLMISAYGGDDHLDIVLVDSTNTFSFGNRWGNRALTGRWTHVFSPALFGRMIALYSKYHSDITLDFFGTTIALRNRVRDVTLKGDLDYFASADHTVRTGVDLTFYRFDYGWQFDQWEGNQVVEPYLLSTYVQDSWQVTPLTEARLGLRGTYYEEGGRLFVNPRLSINRVLHEGWRLKLAGGSYRQYLQLVSTEGFSGGDVWVSVDETVEPGRSWQAVTGVEWEPSGTYRVSVESYYTDLANLVVIDQEAEENVEQETSEDIFKTGGEGYAAGLELFAEKRRGRLSGWLGYTLGWTRRTFPEIDGGGSFPPKYDRRHDLSLTATYRLAKWSWTANLVYGTGQAFTPASARYTLRDPASDLPVDRYLAARRNTARLLPYHRLDVSMRRRLRLFDAECEFYLQIFNAYNRRNEWFIQYHPDDSDKKPAVAEMLPIIPTFGFDFRF